MPTIEQFVKDGFLKLKDKDGEINIPVENTREIAEAIIDPVSWLNAKFVNQKGEIDYASFARAVAFVSNPDKFSSTMIKYAKGLGKEAVVAELKNSAPIVSKKNADQKSSNPDDNPEGFMDAFEKSLKAQRR